MTAALALTLLAVAVALPWRRGAMPVGAPSSSTALVSSTRPSTSVASGIRPRNSGASDTGAGSSEVASIRPVIVRPGTLTEELPGRSRAGRDGMLRAGLAVSLGMLIGLAARSALGVVLGAGIAYATWRLLNRAAARSARGGARVAPVLDLAVLLLRSGAPPTRAFADATVLGDERLSALGARISALESMGQAPARLWADLVADEDLRPVARAALRSADSGAALADAWSSVASAERSRSSARAEGAARRAAVHALGPLGLCFLPAFICVAVVPMVVGLLGDVFA